MRTAREPGAWVNVCSFIFNRITVNGPHTNGAYVCIRFQYTPVASLPFVEPKHKLLLTNVQRRRLFADRVFTFSAIRDYGTLKCFIAGLHGPFIAGRSCFDRSDERRTPVHIAMPILGNKKPLGISWFWSEPDWPPKNRTLQARFEQILVR